MNINIKGTNIELTSAIHEYVTKRLGAVQKFVSDDPTVQCDVEVGKTSNHHKNGDIFRAEIHIVGHKRDIYVASEKGDLYAAIDEVRDEVLYRLSSKKEKAVSFARRGGAKVKNLIRGMFNRE